MLVEGRVPTAEEAIRYFKRMSEGKLPRQAPKKGRRNTLTGTWGSGVGRYYPKHPLTGSWGIRNTPRPTVNLVTPVAMNVEQAKAKLRKIGQWPVESTSKPQESTPKRPRKEANLVKKKMKTQTKKTAKKPVSWAMRACMGYK